MDTLQRRTLIPLFVGLFLAGCTAHATGRAAQRDPAPARAAIEVHNQSRDRIHVYLISNGKGEWLLGRVDPLETARLPLPERASTAQGEIVRLAIIAGARISLRPSRHDRALLSMDQPMADLLIQQWIFTGSQLTNLPRPGLRQ